MKKREWVLGVVVLFTVFIVSGFSSCDGNFCSNGFWFKRELASLETKVRACAADVEKFDRHCSSFEGRWNKRLNSVAAELEALADAKFYDPQNPRRGYVESKDLSRLLQVTASELLLACEAYRNGHKAEAQETLNFSLGKWAKMQELGEVVLTEADCTVTR